MARLQVEALRLRQQADEAGCRQQHRDQCGDRQGDSPRIHHEPAGGESGDASQNGSISLKTEESLEFVGPSDA